MAIDVYMDPTSGTLGTTKLTRVLNANIHISDRFGPVWVLNTANNSYVATVETEPSAELTLLVEADAAVDGAAHQSGRPQGSCVSPQTEQYECMVPHGSGHGPRSKSPESQACAGTSASSRPRSQR